MEESTSERDNTSFRNVSLAMKLTVPLIPLFVYPLRIRRDSDRREGQVTASDRIGSHWIAISRDASQSIAELYIA